MSNTQTRRASKEGLPYQSYLHLPTEPHTSQSQHSLCTSHPACNLIRRGGATHIALPMTTVQPVRLRQALLASLRVTAPPSTRAQTLHTPRARRLSPRRGIATASLAASHHLCPRSHDARERATPFHASQSVYRPPAQRRGSSSSISSSTQLPGQGTRADLHGAREVRVWRAPSRESRRVRAGGRASEATYPSAAMTMSSNPVTGAP